MTLHIESAENSLVVLGFMNPSIHHPSWYRRAGLLDADAEELAQKDENLICSPTLAQFQIASLSIMCLPNQWRVATTDEDTLERIVKLGVEVFDRKLPETPITASGLNFNYHVSTDRPDTGLYLSEIVERSPLGMISTSATWATLKTRAVNERGHTETRVEPSSLAKNCLFIASNYHYVAEGIDATGHFDIGASVGRFLEDREDARRKCQLIVNAVNQETEGHENGSNA